MRITISFKLVFLVVASVMVSGISALLVSYYSVGNGIEQVFMDALRNERNIVQERVELLQKQYKSLAAAQAVRPNVIKGVATGDFALLQQLGKDLMGTGQTDFIVYTDAQGKVLARGHDDTHGDSIAEQQCVKLALAGQGCALFEPGKVVKVSLRASAPVRQEGRIIGTVIVGMNVSYQDAFVDAVKKLLNVEATIFYGNVRESTTIERDGKRVVGTTMDNPAVLDAVLGRGQDHILEIALFGRPYMSVYWPFFDASGKPVGMLFLGKDMSMIFNAQDAVFRSILYICLGAMVVLGTVGFLASRKFTKPILKLVAFTHKVEKGDYSSTAGVKTNDEIGDLAHSLDSMVVALKEKVLETETALGRAEEETEKARLAMAEAQAAKEQAERAKLEGMLQAADRLEGVVEVVTSASEQLSAQIEQSSSGTQDQARRVSETATAMEEMTATVLEVANNASLAADNSEQAKSKAQHGSKVVSDLVRSIGQVQDAALELKTDISGLGKQAEEIGQIMNVISDIADQTNLLALNAAIEAARAGEAGRGFAVVADEVRKLAEKTMSATKQVGDAIRGIQQSTRKNIDNVERSSQRIEEATALAQDSGSALNEIVRFVDVSTDQVRSIATASEQQSAASEEINRSIDDVNRIAGETAQAMQESAKAVSELANQAQILQRLIDEMKRGA